MKTFYTKALVLATAVATCTGVNAQDYHLSHYESAPLYLNPALTGMPRDIKGVYRITSDFRSQWKSLGINSFKTFYVGYDHEIKTRNDRFGVGGYMINHRAGLGQFNSFTIMASGSYDITKRKSPHILRTGIQVGILNKSYRNYDYTFNEQYNANTGEFDPSMNSNEDFQRASIYRFDAAAGIYYKYYDVHSKCWPSLGVALHHITMPNESFTSVERRLPIRYVIHSDCRIALQKELAITPKVLFMSQGKAIEINGGAQLTYKVDDRFTIIPGIWYRYKDAIIADLGFQLGNTTLRFSYDINTSYLNRYTGGRGAFEVSLVMIGKKGEPLVPVRSFF